MDLGELHTKCKIETRKAFEEFKRQLQLDLFNVDNDLKSILQYHMSQEIRSKVIKHFIENHTTTQQIKYLQTVTDDYVNIAIKTSNSFFMRAENK